MGPILRTTAFGWRISQPVRRPLPTCGARDTAPGTGGVTFTNFGGYALLAGNWVVFLAPEGAANGLYSVNITSKTIVRLANQATNLPGLGTAATFTYGNNTSYLPQSDGSLVVFQATSLKARRYIALSRTGKT